MRKSFGKIGNFIQLLVLLYSIFRKLKLQKKFVQKVLFPVVEQVKFQGDSSLQSYDYHKILHYYGVGTPVVLGDGLAKLRGFQLDEQEKKAITFMSAITGLFDDFFDKTNHSEEDILQMMNSPKTYRAKNSRELLFVNLSLKALENIPNQESLSEINSRVFEAQWASKHQKNNNLGVEELRDLSYQKGGVALLFWRLALKNPLKKNEDLALFRLGEYLQYANDVFDVLKDLEEGVYTHVNKSKNVQHLIIEFSQKMDETFACFLQLDYPKNNIRNFINQFKIVGAQALLCLNQYKKAQDKHGGDFSPSLYSRKEMICDMQKTTNLFKAVHYYLSIK